VDLTDVRDISTTQVYPDEVLRGLRYSFPDKATADIKKWVRLDDFTLHGECIVRTSEAGDEWVTLSLSARDDDRLPDDDSWSSPYLGVSLFYSSIFVDATTSLSATTAGGRDAFDSKGAGCYSAYIAEYPEGAIFDQLLDHGEVSPKGMQFSELILSRGGEWEYDYSHTTPEQQEHFSVPCRDLVRHLALRWDRQRGWVDASGELVVFESQMKRRSGLFIRRSSLNQYLNATSRKLVYRRFANRGLYKSTGSESSQIDLLTWLLYQTAGAPIVQKQDARPFNC
jgi:hypothetical protein